jgi:hypothetical protein
MSNIEKLCMSGVIREMMYVEIEIQAVMRSFGARDDGELFYFSTSQH